MLVRLRADWASMASRASVEDGADRRVERWGCERRTAARFERWAWRVMRRDWREKISASRSSVVDIMDAWSDIGCRVSLMVLSARVELLVA